MAVSGSIYGQGHRWYSFVKQQSSADTRTVEGAHSRYSYGRSRKQQLVLAISPRLPPLRVRLGHMAAASATKSLLPSARLVLVFRNPLVPSLTSGHQRSEACKALPIQLHSQCLMNSSFVQGTMMPDIMPQDIDRVMHGSEDLMQTSQFADRKGHYRFTTGGYAGLSRMLSHRLQRSLSSERLTLPM